MSPFATISEEVVDVRGPVDEQEGTAAIACVGTSESGGHHLEGGSFTDGGKLPTSHTHQRSLQATRSCWIGASIPGTGIEPKG